MRLLLVLSMLLAGCQTAPKTPEQIRAMEIRNHCSKMARSAPVQQEPTGYVVMLGAVVPMSGRGQGLMEMQQREVIEEECLWRYGLR